MLRAIVALLGVTYRFRIVEGAEHLQPILVGHEPRVITLWHNRLIPGITFLLRHLVRKGANLITLASLSGDGELIARVLEGWGIEVVRGSSSRGGIDAMRRLHGLIRDRRASVVLTPDGPRGPLYEFKLGGVMLARTTPASILPLGLAARRFVTIRSWDRMLVPWPFTTIAAVVGEPIPVERQHPRRELESLRQQIESTQSILTRRAEAYLGVRDASEDDLPVVEGFGGDDSAARSEPTSEGTAP